MYRNMCNKYIASIKTTDLSLCKVMFLVNISRNFLEKKLFNKLNHIKIILMAWIIIDYKL